MAQFRQLFDRLIAAHPSDQIRGLIHSAGVMNFAVSSIALFEPIYLRQLGFSAVQVLMFYFAVYGLMFLLLPFGARLSRAYGLQHAMLASSPFLIASFAALYAMESHPWMVAAAALCKAVYIVLYWPSFHGTLAGFGREGEGGREISSVGAAMMLSGIVGPMFGGVMIESLGFPALFGVAGLLILASNVRALASPEPHDGGRFEALPAFGRLVDPARRRELVGVLGFGEDLFGLVIWPIFIYETLGGTTVTGALVSVSLLVTAMLSLFIGRVADAQSRHAVLRTGTIFMSFAWLVRALAGGPLAVFGADAFYRFSGETTWIPFLSLVYSRARRGGKEMLERIVFFEQALALSKILACLLGIALLALFPDSYQALFVLGALFSLLYAAYP